MPNYSITLDPFYVEAATGFEPVNNGFADRCLSHLAMPPLFLERANGFEPSTSTLARWHSTAELRPPLNSTPTRISNKPVLSIGKLLFPVPDKIGAPPSIEMKFNLTKARLVRDIALSF